MAVVLKLCLQLVHDNEDDEDGDGWLSASIVKFNAYLQG